METSLVADPPSIAVSARFRDRGLRIPRQGRLYHLSSQPEECIGTIAGDIWWRACEQDELAGLREEHQVISTKRRAGKITLHVHATEAPAGFESVQPDLEDVYFATLAGAQRDA